MNVEDRVRIQHALDATEKAMEFMRDISQKDFAVNEMLQLAIVRLLEIIGEAANSVSSECKKIYTTIPWKKMIAMRNRLIHGYFDVDHEIVWDTVKRDLPPVAASLRKLLQESR